MKSDVNDDVSSVSLIIAQATHAVAALFVGQEVLEDVILSPIFGLMLRLIVRRRHLVAPKSSCFQATNPDFLLQNFPLYIQHTAAFQVTGLFSIFTVIVAPFSDTYLETCMDSRVINFVSSAPFYYKIIISLA